MKANDIVEGPGTSDMKGGDVIMIAAPARHAGGGGPLKDADITVVMTGDEENGAGRWRWIART